MHLWCSGLKRHWLLVTEACKMSILVTSFALELLSQTIETFYMLWISTLGTSIFSFVSLLRIKFLFEGWHLMLIVITWIPLVTLWSGLERFTFLLVLAWWEVCSLMSHQIDMAFLGVTCNLLFMMCSSLWCLHFLCKLPDFAGRKLL